MIKDITIGQFFPGKSMVHRLDPRVKLILTMTFIITIFLCKNFFALGIMLFSLILIIISSKISIKLILRGIKPLLFIIVFTAFLNIFFMSTGEVLLEYKFIVVTTGGVFTAIFMAIRIISLIIASSLLTYTTSPTMITDGIERLLSPLKFMKNGVHTVAMMMTIALRFIPTLIEEFDKITNAQKARGANLETGSLVQRAKALIPIFVPLFITSFRRAYELAFAMECRCYQGGEGRTRMKQMKTGLIDIYGLAFMAVILGAVIFLNYSYTHVI
ncbi:MAG: energy-coupling factor transporter transmembrane protein EcfT [Oscillospiraceae bacterium]|nr:energy-coupling factor transporter transmembrane protein EcfT [Oscillospiraceae bacterium]